MPDNLSDPGGPSSDLASTSDDRLRSVFEVVDDGIIVIDSNGVIDRVNPAMERLFGYSARELIGRRVNALMPSDYAAAHDLYLSKYIRTGTRHVIGIGREVVGLHKDGHTFPMELAVSEYRVDGRRMFTGLVRDLSARRATDQALQRNAQALEASANALAAARRAAEDAAQARSRFLSLMSHEIRTPMTAIVGFTEMLPDLPHGSAEAAGLYADISRNANYLRQLVDDVLEMAQIDVGQIDLRPGPVDLPEMLEGVIAESRPAAERKGLRLEFEFAGPIPRHIQTDAARLNQVLGKLVANAVKFTEMGEVRVIVRHRPERATVSFDVIDTGIGMTPDELRLVFEPFVQGDMSMTRRFGGAGLGLAIAKRVCELLGGRITVDSAPGAGSRFCVSLPTGPIDPAAVVLGGRSMRPRGDGPPSRIENDSAGALEGVEVLLAEDGPDNQRLIEVMLRKAGATLTVVKNGREAVDLACGSVFGQRANDPPRPFDVILMDMQMPVLDGYSATAELRRRGYARPILALTAHALVGDKRKCLEAGCDDFASKSIHQAELIALVARHAARYRSRPAGFPK